eukprot:scaffold12276_cov37-Phaeocystis_antarctica.AAC.2
MAWWSGSGLGLGLTLRQRVVHLPSRRKALGLGVGRRPLVDPVVRIVDGLPALRQWKGLLVTTLARVGVVVVPGGSTAVRVRARAGDMARARDRARARARAKAGARARARARVVSAL